MSVQDIINTFGGQPINRERDFVTNGMNSGQLTPDLSNLPRNLAPGGNGWFSGPSYDNLVELNNNFRSMPKLDQLKTMVNIGQKDEVENVAGYMVNPIPFKDMTAEQAGATLGLEMGSPENKAYVEWYNSKKALGDREFADVRGDFYAKVQNKRHALSQDLLAAAEDPTPYLKLQEKMYGLDRSLARYPVMFFDEAENTIFRGAKGVTQLGLTAAYEINKASDDLNTALFNTRPGTGLQNRIKDSLAALDKFEPTIAPIVREGFIDNQTAALGNLLGQLSVAAIGGPIANGAMSFGLATETMYSNTQNMNLEDRMRVVEGLGMLNATMNYISLDMYLRGLKFKGLMPNYLGGSVIRAAGEGVEETMQGVTEDLAAIQNEISTGQKRRSLDWANIFAGGGYGVTTSFAASALGLPRVAMQQRRNMVLTKTINTVIEPGIEILESEAIPEEHKSQAIKDIMGPDYARRQSYLDAEALVELGSEAVRLTAMETGIPESTIREAAVMGQSVRVTLGDTVVASIRHIISEDIGPMGEYRGIQDTVDMLIDPSYSREEKIEALVDAVEKQNKPRRKKKVAFPNQTMEEGVVQEESQKRAARRRIIMEGVDELLDLAEQVDEARVIGLKIEAGTATPQEMERYQRFTAENGLAAGVVADESQVVTTGEEDVTDWVMGVGALATELNNKTITMADLTPAETEAVQRLARSPESMRMYANALSEVAAALNPTGEVRASDMQLTEDEVAEAIEGIDEDELDADGVPARLAAIKYMQEQKASRIKKDLEVIEAAVVKGKRGRPRKNIGVALDENLNPIAEPTELTVSQLRQKEFTDQGASVTVNRNMMTITWPDGRVERQQIVPTGNPRSRDDSARNAEKLRRAAERQAKREADAAAKAAGADDEAAKQQAKEAKARLAQERKTLNALTKKVAEQAKTPKGVAKSLVNLEAKQLVKTKVKEMVRKNQKKTIHGLLRASPESATVNALQLSKEQIEDLLHDGLRQEEMSVLDDLGAIKRIRADILRATQGDQKQTSVSMQLLKAALVNFGHNAGLTPAQYTNSLYLQVMLKNRVISRFIDSVTAMNERISQVKQKDMKKLAKAFVGTDLIPDNQFAVDRIASGIDEADGMMTPDGKKVSFLWGQDEGFFLRKIADTYGQDLVNSIPEIITKSNFTERTNKAGVTTRVYDTPVGRLFLVAYNDNFIITDYQTKPQEVSQDAVSESVAHLMAQTNLVGEYRNALRGYLTNLVNQGTQVNNIVPYENLVKKAIDASNGFSERARQILEVTDNLTKNIDPAFMKVVGDIEIADGWTVEKGAIALKELITKLQKDAESFKYFYTNPGITQALERLVSPAQIAWHGSPSLFNEFRNDKISSGEGSQSRGIGIYFTASEEIAKWYADVHRQIINNDIEQYFEAIMNDEDLSSMSGSELKSLVLEAIGGVARTDGNIGSLVSALYDKITSIPGKKFTSDGYTPDVDGRPIIDFISDTGAIYKADIPEDSEFVNYDTPINQQSPALQAKLLEALPGIDVSKTFGDIRNSLTDYGDNYVSDTTLSKTLLAAGIPGIVYTGEIIDGTSKNYVVFDPNSAHIIETLATGYNRQQILEVGNKNGDGLTYEQWLDANARGKFLPTLARLRTLRTSTENAPFWSYENRLDPYNRATLVDNIGNYLAANLVTGDIDADNQIIAFLGETKIAEYIAGMAEYAGFIMNTDPRVFADLEVQVVDLREGIKGQYQPGDNKIELASAEYEKLFTGTKEAFAEVGSTLAHEFNHQMTMRMLAVSGQLESVEVGPMYRAILKAAGVSEYGLRDVSSFGRDSQSAISQEGVYESSKHNRYLSKVEEQFAFLAGQVFSSEYAGRGIPVVDEVYAKLKPESATVFNSPQIRKDLGTIQGLFAAISQPELIYLLNSKTQFQMALGQLSKLGPRIYSMELNGGRFNYSTIPHEFFHLFLDLAKSDNPTLYTAIAGEGELTIEKEEVLARQFENYLLGGKAPSLGLRRVFNQYSEWLSNIYDEKFRGQYEVNENLKRLFDKFFASEQQIRLKESLAGYERSLLDALAVDNPKRAGVARAENKARLTAREYERRKIIGKYMQLSGEDKKLRDEARKTVGEDAFNTMVAELVQAGVLKPRSIYQNSVVDLEKMVKPKMLGELLETMAEWNGSHPNDEIASPEAFLTRMKDRGSIATQTTAEFNRIKMERYAQLLSEYEGMDFMSDEAVFSKDRLVYMDKLQEAIDFEANAKGNKRLNQILTADLRTKAEEDMGRMSVYEAMDYKALIGDIKKNLIKYRDFANKKDPVNASRYLNLARKAQYQVYEGIQLRDKVRQLRTGWTQGVGKRLAKMNIDYANNVVAVLNAYGINRNIRQTRLEPLTALTFPQYGKESAGFQDLLMDLNAVIPESIRNLTGAESIETMNVKDFKQLADTLSILEKAGTISLKALKQAQYRDANTMLEDMKAKLSKMKDRPGDYAKSKTYRGRFRGWLDKAGTYGLLNEFIFSKADGFTDIAGKGYGPHRTLFFAAREAASAAEALQDTYQAKMREHFNSFKDSFTKRFARIDKSVFGPITDRLRMQHNLEAWDPEALLMIALNTGNTGNLKALTEGLNMSIEQVTNIMNQFNSTELRAIQGILDVMGELYTPASEVWHNIKGLSPKRVDAVPATYTGGHFKGGYFPLITETTDGRGSQFFQALFPSLDQKASFMNERRENGDRRPPRLDVSIIANHVYSATRLIAMGETMDMVNKIVHDKEWSSLFIRKFGRLKYNDVLQHFGNMANPHSMYDQNSSWGGQVIDWLRGNAVTAALGFRFVSGLKQRSDILQSLNIMAQQNRAPAGRTAKTLMKTIWGMGVKGNIGLYSRAVYDEVGNVVVDGKVVDPRTLDIVQTVFLKSDYAKARDRRVDMDLRHLTKNAVGLNTSTTIFGREVSRRTVHDAFFTFLRYNDRAAFASVWYTQYQLAKEGLGTFDIAGKTEAEIEKLAVRDADAVGATMSSNAIADLTASQRDATTRLFTTFISAQIRKTSRSWQSVEAFRAGKISASHMFGNLAVEYYGRVIMGMLASQLINSFTGGDEEDKENGLSTLAYGLLTEPLWGTLDGIPILSSVSGWGRGYGRSVLSTPTQTSLDVATADMKKAWKGMLEGDMWDAIKYTSYAGGYFTRIPIRAPSRDIAKVYKALGFDKEKTSGR